MFDDQGYNSINEFLILNIFNSFNFSDDDLDFDEDFLEEVFFDDFEDEYLFLDYIYGKWKLGESFY